MRNDWLRRCRTWVVSRPRLLPLRGHILLNVRYVLFAAGIVWCSAHAAAQEVVYQDEEVKAAFLYHFATFVQWPEMPSERTFSVAVLGADEVAAQLEKFLPGREIQGRPMEVRRLESLDDLEDEAMLFIGAEENYRLPELISRVADRSMLIVTEASGALKDGSMINFQLIDDRVRFEISLLAAQRAGLELSSRLLSAAMSVDTTSAIPAPALVIFAKASPALLRL